MDGDRYPDELASAEKVLEELPRDVRMYELQLAIEEQEKVLERKLHSSLNYPFDIKFIYVDAIAVQKNGKYEDFVSLL